MEFLLLALAFALFCVLPSAAQTTLQTCPTELQALAVCLAQTSEIETVQECVDCTAAKLGEEDLGTVTDCATFNEWYCGAVTECTASCGTGCEDETLALAICILTEGGQNPPQEDCAIECATAPTVVTAAPPTVSPPPTTAAPTPSPDAPNVTVCTQDGDILCNQTFQVCYSTDGNETCGNCINGYVEFPPNEDTPNCTLIEDLPWQEFFDYFQENDPPIYLQDLSAEDRLKLLYITLRIISSENSQIPPLSYKLGINKFSADTDEERQSLLGYFYNESAVDAFDFGRRLISDRELQEDLPRKKNWVDDGAVTNVKDQGRCGCCWAESVVGAVEGAVAVTPENKGFLQSLSIQQLISCDDKNLGCNGGNIVYATGYSWKTDFGGLATRNDYPYTDSQGTTTEDCLLETGNKTPAVWLDNPIIVVTYSDDFSREERVQIMKSALARQPISMALRSNCNEISTYQSGILTVDGACACEEVSCIDHAVLLVGYDDTSNPPSWILKNSWGTGWGEGGYFRISQLGGGRWGLFGMLGEGVVPLEAYNSTFAEPDQSLAVNRHSMTWWSTLGVSVLFGWFVW